MVESELVTVGILRRVPIVITSTYTHLIIKRERNTIQNGSIITFDFCSSPPSTQTPGLAQIELQDRLNLHSIKALHYMRSQRPKNTSKAYVNKHKEWQVEEQPFVSRSYEKLTDATELLQKAWLPRRRIGHREEACLLSRY